MTLKTLPTFVEELKDLYSAENQLLRVLPKMAKVASTPQLRQALIDHLHQTQVHVHRLDRIFLRLGAGPKGNNCTSMESLIAEARQLMNEETKSAGMDAALIAAAQRMEHFQLNGYECARTVAHDLGHNNAAKSLQQSLEEKHATDDRLTQLAESSVYLDVQLLKGKT
jgi:ferritin-like metal-binding protein YciE